MKNSLKVDSSTGGKGDIWMRLVALYSTAVLVPHLSIHVKIPTFLRGLAHYTFGDRLFISTKESTNFDIIYTVKGLKDIWKEIVKGKHFVIPYQRAVFKDKKKKKPKDYLNKILFSLLDNVGLVSLPSWEIVEKYQGFLEIQGIKQFRHIEYRDFEKQLIDDYDVIINRLASGYPKSHNLILSGDFNESVVVFPNGTSRQFVPVWWAKKNMPDAYYAFFYKDEEAQKFQKQGLKTIYFYEEPGDIIFLAQNAKSAITTDSFPSHLLQSAVRKSTVTITEVLKSRIVSPAFKGNVVDAVAPCHPCLHLARSIYPLCDSGFSECLNWKDQEYTSKVVNG